MKQQNWFVTLLHYADGQRGKFVLSILFSIASVVSGLLPYYCFYRVLELFISGTLTSGGIVRWSLLALAFCLAKALLFSLSTGLSHHVAFHVLTGLRRRIAGNFLHAPLGSVQKFSIGEIKNLLVDKTENLEPPLAHVVPEGAGHLVLPLVSLIALVLIDWRLALGALVTVPAAVVCMLLTFVISGESFQKYNDSNAYMNSTIVEYVEGIEVIKAFGKAGVSYEKYAAAITDFRTFVLKWMSSTWITMKLAFALFPSTLLGVLPVSLWLAGGGVITAAQACLAVMLSMSMVSSLARLEVFSESVRQMQTTVEELQSYLTMERLPEADHPADLADYSVSLSGVRFSYGEDSPEVLHGIDLDLPRAALPLWWAPPAVESPPLPS